jgi:hypothetical protein
MIAAVALFDWLGGRRRKAARARQKGLTGDLEKAAQLYLEVEMPDDAARVLLLKADAEVEVERRMVLCAQAARVGADSAHGREAARRKALLGFDLVKAARGATMRGELLRAAAELEAVEQWQAAAEAFALAGDQDGEIRVLKEAGAIGELEDRLQKSSDAARRERDLAALLRRMRDLDALGERRQAIAAARAWLEREHDEELQLQLERVRSKLLHGPVVTLEVNGERRRYVLGSQITIGRANADIVVHSSGVSRQHLRLSRRGGAPVVEDLETRNGTTLAGANVRGSLPVGGGLALELGGQVACTVVPLSTAPDAPIAIEVAGERYLAPLGPMGVGRWVVVDAHDGDDRFVVLRSSADADPPHMGDYQLAREIELCVGDRISAQRHVPVVLSVPGGG